MCNEEKPTKWIKCEEQTPLEGERILWYWPEGNYKIPCFVFGYYDGRDYQTEDQKLLCGSWEVTHWLRIPQLPKE